MLTIQLHESWLAPLAGEFEQPYMAVLKQFLATERAAGKVIYPPARQWFHALDATPLEAVRVVILGQDPYHGPGQAHGLSFSVPLGVKIPPSLQNIYKELQDDLGIPAPKTGNLEAWARQGVLLLNAVLTVEAHTAGAHQGKGWERFTDAIIRLVNAQNAPTVFMLWGSYAQQKAGFVDTARHLVLKSVHPSPLSAHRGFFGTKPFSKANQFLEGHGRGSVDWGVG
ncbi:MAG: uracil-DNA glycosylase [Ahrensia sp.]|nr:uracil-DNA glycosylase [Ahrensia sp.]